MEPTERLTKKTIKYWLCHLCGKFHPHREKKVIIHDNHLKKIKNCCVACYIKYSTSKSYEELRKNNTYVHIIPKDKDFTPWKP